MLRKGAQKYVFFLKQPRKKGGPRPPFHKSADYRLPDDGHIDCLLALGARANFELDRLALVE